jgi:hypothetical protein
MVLNRTGTRTTAALVQRVTREIGERLAEKREVFPGKGNVTELVGLPEQCAILDQVDLSGFQKKWVRTHSDDEFLVHMARTGFLGVDDGVRGEINARFTRIVRKAFVGYQDAPPTVPEVQKKLRAMCGSDIDPHTIAERTMYLDEDTGAKQRGLHEMQLAWVNTASTEMFLRHHKSISLVCDATVKEAVETRLRGTVSRAIARCREFPTSHGIVKQMLRGTDQGGINHRTVEQAFDFAAEQKRWIATRSDWQILNAKVNRLPPRSVDASVSEAFELRVQRAMENLAGNLPKLFPTLVAGLDMEQTFLREASGGRLSADQKIALGMQVWRGSRSERLHGLIGQRLIQLWGFRELYVLASSGHFKSGLVVSMFHETVPTRLAELVPDSIITHQFVDDLFAGRIATQEQPILLLSFVHWLTETQTATMLTRLNQAMQNGGKVLITAPLTCNNAEGMDRTLELFGFGITAIGELHLEGKGRKLSVDSRVIELEKVGEPVQHNRARLFDLVRLPKNRTGNARLTQDLTYVQRDLLEATARVAMHEEPRITVKEVALGDGHAMMTLSGGMVVGIGMGNDPKVVEIEWKVAPRGGESTLIRISNGEEGKVAVPPTMRNEYIEFLRRIKDMPGREVKMRKLPIRSTQPVA